MANLYVGDVVTIKLSTGIDVSGYSTLEILYKKPNASTGTWTATIESGDNQTIKYTTSGSDLNLAGPWTVQAHVATPGELHGELVTFNVLTPIA